MYFKITYFLTKVTNSVPISHSLWPRRELETETFPGQEILPSPSSLLAAALLQSTETISLPGAFARALY